MKKERILVTFIVIALFAVIAIPLSNANSPPNTPSSPSPANGATGVSINTDLSWTCTDPDGDTLVYDIAFDLALPPQPVASNYSSTTYDPGTLNYNTTYYWIITAKDPSGATNSSAEWSFTTESAPNNQAPSISNPSPANGATNVSVNPTLSVYVSDQNGGNVYVFFYNASDHSQIDGMLVSANTTVSTTKWSNLSYNTTYSWYVVANDSELETTSATWHFTTAPANETPNNPPTCSLSATPSSGTAPLTLNFSMSASDSDGSITAWQLDVDNDGSTEYSGTGSPPTTQQHIYVSSGTYTAKLTVTDNNNDTGYATATITVTNASTGGGWLNWKLPLSYFSMFVIGMIGLIGVAMSAFFLKPESIKHVGYAPAAGSLLVTVFLIAAILMYHAGIAWYWIAGVVLLIFFILYVTLKVVLFKKRRLAKSVLGRKKVKRRRR